MASSVRDYDQAKELLCEACQMLTPMKQQLRYASLALTALDV